MYNFLIYLMNIITLGNSLAGTIILAVSLIGLSLLMSK